MHPLGGENRHNGCSNQHLRSRSKRIKTPLLNRSGNTFAAEGLAATGPTAHLVDMRQVDILAFQKRRLAYNVVDSLRSHSCLPVAADDIARLAR